MSESFTTSNGFEIRQPTAEISATELKQRLDYEYGIKGNNPSERLSELKQLSVEGAYTSCFGQASLRVESSHQSHYSNSNLPTQ